ncbi:MAG TPA: helix-turn-helix transcriptional regulator [Baekduia sp.]|nr:helix-turn-helix transcriptional regulator [Baekduia sp.]
MRRGHVLSVRRIGVCSKASREFVGRYVAAMPAREDPGTKAETKLARWRMHRGLTQEELAVAIGISLPTYRRLERASTDNPPLRYLQNAALALGVELDDVIEDSWREWKTFSVDAARPPDPASLWRPVRHAGDGATGLRREDRDWSARRRGA